MARWKVRSMKGGDVADDGSTVELHVYTETRKSHVLILRYEHFNWLIQALLQMSNALYDRQVAHGQLPGGIVADAAMIAEGFTVPVNHKEKFAVLQVVGRQNPNAPIGLGSIRINNPSMLRSLGSRLLEVADELEQRSRLS